MKHSGYIGVEMWEISAEIERSNVYLIFEIVERL